MKRETGVHEWFATVKKYRSSKFNISFSAKKNYWLKRAESLKLCTVA